MSEVLNGPDDGCQEMFRMDKHVFHNLCGILRQRAMLRVLRAVLDDPDQNFPFIPEGKYYIVDTGYSNLEGFIALYLHYHLHEFRVAPQYGFHVQRDIVIAACVLHYYIRHEGKYDWLFANVYGVVAVAELPDIDDESDIQLASSIQDHMAFSLLHSGSYGFLTTRIDYGGNVE
ncbi:hypothetical protein OIU79_030813 [Salix purpurea]|uniref:DUF8040 domain-containing protein n=1 Tax=Salix purpurea TaxID=77065 RepID=A0A9Q0VA71_SALPP|nr:hypothetical protein OIU79_030813 [Salix purpurea]